MNDKLLLEALSQMGLDSNAFVRSWTDSIDLLAALDAMGRRGSTALVKIDGGRADGPVYTVVVSGGRLGEAFFRKDGASLERLLHEAVTFYVAQVAAEGPGE